MKKREEEVNLYNMHKSVVNSVNKYKNAEIFTFLRDSLKAVVDNTSGIGWGFHDALREYYGRTSGS